MGKWGRVARKEGSGQVLSALDKGLDLLTDIICLCH